MSNIEQVASAMYWARVNSHCEGITLSVVVHTWDQLPENDEVVSWHCKQFWRDAAKAAIAAMREPTEEMIQASDDCDCALVHHKSVFQMMIDAALKD